MSQKAYVQGSAFPPLKDGVLRLYSMRFCPYAMRTILVLNHKNIPYETVNINLKKKPDWFLALNPLGQVPVLQIDDKVVVESTATCDWLDDVYPENRLQPADPYRRAWDRVLTEYIGKVSQTLMALARAEADQMEEKIAEIEKHLKFYEEKLKARNEGPFFGGKQPAMADFIMWPAFERFHKLAAMKGNPKMDINPDKFPLVTSYVKAMREVPAVKNTAIDAETHIKFFKSTANEVPDYDLGLEE